jgi:hypothetical protein
VRPKAEETDPSRQKKCCHHLCTACTEGEGVIADAYVDNHTSILLSQKYPQNPKKVLQ